MKKGRSRLSGLIGRIYLEDCREFMGRIEDNSIDLIIADPPYNLSKKRGLKWKFSSHVTMQESWDIFKKEKFFNFNVKWLFECLRILKPGGSLWVCGTYHNIYQLEFILQNLDEVRIINSIVWFKSNAQPNITCRMFTESTEYLIWAVKGGKKWTFNYRRTKKKIFDRLNPKGKQTRNVWSIPVTPKREKCAGGHPNQKPLELMRRIILSCSKKGDIVYDPFTGSGTSVLIARDMGRQIIGSELNPDFFRLLIKRFKIHNKSKK